jgi:DNA-binding transcriptional LysR family regulator
MDRRRPPRLSLDLLRGFRVAARHLSFTRAARELCVTQSAISREIKVLERQLGQPLFLRVNRTLQLTQAGKELYRATDEALALIDSATERLSGSGGVMGVTTTTALASLWLVPRLPGFTRVHPEVDVRVAATNDAVDLEREHLDIAIRYVPPGADIPNGELLAEYKQFPVCSPAILRARARRLRTPADLARHVRLDFETVLYGRPWYDWDQWFEGVRLQPIEPAGTLRFSHYDQVIQAAIEGAGVAIGKIPHLARHLREGRLCAPLGERWVASLGGFHVVLGRRAAGRDAVAAFVGWLRDEVRADAAPERPSRRSRYRVRM